MCVVCFILRSTIHTSYSYGISVTTLEEVFLRVERDETEDNATRKAEMDAVRRVRSAHSLKKGDEDDVKSPEKGPANFHLTTIASVETEEASFFRQFKALIVKR